VCKQTQTSPDATVERRQRAIDLARHVEKDTNATAQERIKVRDTPRRPRTIDHRAVLQVLQTGAKITLPMSTGLLYYYCAKLAAKEPEFVFVSCSMTTDDDDDDDAAPSPPRPLYACVVRLPDGAPVPEVRGPPCASKREAKRWASLEACRVLRQHGTLDGFLLPLLQKHEKVAMAEKEHQELQLQQHEQQDEQQQHQQQRNDDDDDEEAELSKSLMEASLHDLHQVRTSPMPVPRALSGDWPLDPNKPLRVHLYVISIAGACRLPSLCLIASPLPHPAWVQAPLCVWAS